MIRKIQVMALMFSLIMVSGCPSPSSNPSASSGALIAADELRKLTETRNLKGKVTIVDFWATWCPPCKKQIPVLIKLQDKYRQKGFQVIGVSIDRPSFRVSDPKAAVEKMAKQFGINYPVGIADEKLTAKFPPFQAIPTAYIFDREGKRVQTLTGYNTEATLDKIIKELL